MLKRQKQTRNCSLFDSKPKTNTGVSKRKSIFPLPVKVPWDICNILRRLLKYFHFSLVSWINNKLSIFLFILGTLALVWVAWLDVPNYKMPWNFAALFMTTRYQNSFSTETVTIFWLFWVRIHKRLEKLENECICLNFRYLSNGYFSSDLILLCSCHPEKYGILGNRWTSHGAMLCIKILPRNWHMCKWETSENSLIVACEIHFW